MVKLTKFPTSLIFSFSVGGFSILPLFLLLPALLILGELAFFLSMTHSAQVLEKVDLIAVFSGESGRVEEGYRLANQGYGSHLVISSASLKAVEKYQGKLNRSNDFAPIVEDQARTTLENAFHIKRILSEQGMHSVILVTSWEHMPRSYLLLRILTLGSGIRIQCSSVPTGAIDGDNWYGSLNGWKRAYNEMVELRGSLYELAEYRVRGGLPEEPPNQSTVVALLRKMLLFELQPIRS
jgi:uncharacterized SAM-binding protein YcdF (DUF218 family)